MPEQETYDPALDAPPPIVGGSPVEAPTMPAPRLPDEEYYHRQPPQQPRRGAGLGIALIAVGLILLAFQFFGPGLSLGRGGSTTLVDKTLPGSRIELTTAAGDVDVQTWDRPDIRVEAIQEGGERGDYDVNVSGAGGTVRVTESSRNLFWWPFASRGISYRVSVPAGAQATISTASGDIDIAGLAGAVSVGTVSGDGRADELSGGVTVETTSGEIKLDGASGPLELNTVSADIIVNEARDTQLTIGTTSGEVRYEGGLASGSTNEISSISGDVSLELPEGSGFRLDASTVSGDISSEFELSGGQASGRSLTGTAGAGGASLKIGTTSGEIHVSKS
jgi:DUF4097 and DUF4098 domain-containing protein YvlB